jgi:hypothetical protein
MKQFINISLVVIILLLLFAIYKNYTYGTFDTYVNSKKTDCQVNLPKNLKVVYNSYEKKYAIQIKNIWGTKFLWGRNSGRIDESFSVYTNFNDSCTAKSFAVQYLKEQDDNNKKLTGYK